ncbi:MAG: hypothetical protein VB082_01730 [Christensenella sp.]|nr:hypothetical protein [Christensenella sp.]
MGDLSVAQTIRTGKRGRKLYMYRMLVLKSGFQNEKGEKAVITDNRFQIVMRPLQDYDCLGEHFLNVFDVVLLDLCKQPQMGLALLRAIRVSGLRLEVIAYVSRDDISTITKAIRLGVIDCLAEPLDIDRFEQAIRKFIRRRSDTETHAVLKQEQIDVLSGGAGLKMPQLPKGLQKKTLNMIRSVFNRKPDRCFSCEEVVGTVRLSRITVQRYLAYLRQNDELIENINYGTGGRPCSVYRHNPRMAASMMG